jgi:23S rRNA (cytidine1920-2'-O)/16S rRNA (cytidine1409-2'-O)-methyltransferase
MAQRPPERLDKLLASRGLASSRSEAAEMIRRGQVRVMGIRRDKPSSMFAPEVSIEVDAGGKRWVGRGALKLLKALDEWQIDPGGLDCADIGASTGGFTQALLERGASRVAAVDVGYGQLAWELRNDPRVKVLERTNARYVTAHDIGWVSSVVAVDASFISLRTLLPNITGLAREDGMIIALVKPQFEVGRARVGKGVVKSPSLHLEVLEGLAGFAENNCGLGLKGATYSPIRGSEGNVEFIFLMSKAPKEARIHSSLDFPALVGEAHESLGARPQRGEAEIGSPAAS